MTIHKVFINSYPLP